MFDSFNQYDYKLPLLAFIIRKTKCFETIKQLFADV
nr:MAG TPA: hypothetical protein [Caudoviricetes sp.]